MVFAKVKEQQQAKLQSAQSAVASLESELNLKRDERTSAEYKQDLLRARMERDRIANKISAGQAEFEVADMNEAMSALATKDGKTNSESNNSTTSSSFIGGRDPEAVKSHLVPNGEGFSPPEH